MLKDIIHLFILSCEKVSLLTEIQLHTKLSVIERIQLRLHLSLCKSCVCNKEKSIIIHRILTNKTKNIDSQRCEFDEDEVNEIKLEIKKHTCSKGVSVFSKNVK